MTETIIVAIITGGLSLLGVIITSNKTTKDVEAKLEKPSMRKLVGVLPSTITCFPPVLSLNLSSM